MSYAFEIFFRSLLFLQEHQQDMITCQLYSENDLELSTLFRFFLRSEHCNHKTNINDRKFSLFSPNEIAMMPIFRGTPSLSLCTLNTIWLQDMPVSPFRKKSKIQMLFDCLFLSVWPLSAEVEKRKPREKLRNQAAFPETFQNFSFFFKTSF